MSNKIRQINNYYIPVTGVIIVLGIFFFGNQKLEGLLFNSLDVRTVEGVKTDVLRPNIYSENIRGKLDTNLLGNVTLSSRREGDVLVFNNPGGTEIYNLVQNLNKGTVLEMAYDPFTKSVLFYVPVITILNGQEKISSKKEVVAKLQNISSSVMLDIDGDILEVEELNLKPYFVTVESLKLNKIKVLSLKNSDIISRSVGSFDFGMWNSKAGNCSRDVKDSPNVNMSLMNLNGRDRVLILESKGELACTNKNFVLPILNPNSRFFLKLSYKIEKGNTGQYYYRLWGGKTINDVSEQLQKNSDWTSILREIKAAGYKNLNLFLYAPLSSLESSKVLYDNISLSEYAESDGTLVWNYQEEVTLFKDLVLLPGDNRLRVESSLGTEALIEESFENDLWGKVVENCSKNEPGRAEISMKKVTDSTSGASSLELQSKNHSACTHKIFNVKLSPAVMYELSVDYRVLSGSTGKLYYSLLGGTKAVGQNESLPSLSVEGWQTKKVVFSPEINSVNSLDLFLYAESRGEQVKVLYDTISLKPKAWKNNAQLKFVKTDGKNSSRLKDYIKIQGHGLMPFVYLFNIPKVEGYHILSLPIEYSRLNLGLSYSEEFSLPKVVKQIRQDNNLSVWIINEGAEGHMLVLDWFIVSVILLFLLFFVSKSNCKLKLVRSGAVFLTESLKRKIILSTLLANKLFTGVVSKVDQNLMTKSEVNLLLSGKFTQTNIKGVFFVIVSFSLIWLLFGVTAGAAITFAWVLYVGLDEHKEVFLVGLFLILLGVILGLVNPTLGDVILYVAFLVVVFMVVAELVRN